MFAPVESNRKITNMLNAMSYDDKAIKVPEGHSNLFLGIGLWSHRHGLSKGLPIDIVYLLLFAKLVQTSIVLNNVSQKPEFTIILGDSMAMMAAKAVGQEIEHDLEEVMQRYIVCLRFLLDLLNMNTFTRIELASDILQTAEYHRIEEDLLKRFTNNSDPLLRQLPNDAEHFPYYLSQTATVRYMARHLDAGFKISWIKKQSQPFLNQLTHFNDIRTRDELSFDVLYQQMYGRESGMHFLYTKAGLQQVHSDSTEVQEVPPYMAYSEAKVVRYILGKRAVVNPRLLPKRMKARLNDIGLLVRQLSDMCLLEIDSELLRGSRFINYCLEQSDNEGSLSVVPNADEAIHGDSAPTIR